MFQKVSDKFHHRKQPSSPISKPQGPISVPVVHPVGPFQPVTSTQASYPQGPTDGGHPMEGIESSPNPHSQQSHSSAAGSSASSSLSTLPPEARTLSSALGVHNDSSVTTMSGLSAPGGQTTQSRTMSVEMADVSGLSIQSPMQGRNSSVDEERIREKAREAQEQVRE